MKRMPMQRLIWTRSQSTWQRVSQPAKGRIQMTVDGYHAWRPQNLVRWVNEFKATGVKSSVICMEDPLQGNTLFSGELTTTENLKEIGRTSCESKQFSCSEFSCRCVRMPVLISKYSHRQLRRPWKWKKGSWCAPMLGNNYTWNGRSWLYFPDFWGATRLSDCKGKGSSGQLRLCLFKFWPIRYIFGYQDWSFYSRE